MLVVKYGGNAMNAGPDGFIAECAQLVKQGVQLVLVHGGGPQIDAGLRECGIAEKRLAGLRVTDKATLDITERVLCGTVNKALVRAFASFEVAAVGISGEDGGLILAAKKTLPPNADGSANDLGFVGEVVRVNPTVVNALLAAGFVPVIAPLGLRARGDGALNLNADTVAGAIAGALAADPYVVITDVPKVRSDPRDPATGLDYLTLAEAKAHMTGGAFDGGMLPKMEAVFTALESGARRAVIAGGERPLEKALRGEGTVIVP